MDAYSQLPTKLTTLIDSAEAFRQSSPTDDAKLFLASQRVSKFKCLSFSRIPLQMVSDLFTLEVEALVADGTFSYTPGTSTKKKGDSVQV